MSFQLQQTICRAEERSLSVGSGEFVTFVDLADLTWKNCPPMNVLRQAIALLGKHYPYRLAVWNTIDIN